MIKAVTYTHFVTPNGSSTSLCTQQEPCNLTRAVALIGSKDMGPGSTVLVQRGADGIYSQAPLTLAGSGTADKPIKFIGERGVRLTGSRVKPEPSAWTLVPGRRYTYQLDWDEAAQFPALASSATSGGELATDLGRGSPAAVYDAIHPAFRHVVSSALLRPRVDR